jgi:septum formation protein
MPREGVQAKKPVHGFPGSVGMGEERKPLILASRSPRRKEMLRDAGIPFTSEESDYEEDLAIDLPPHELARHLSEGKARAVAGKHDNAVVVAADTFIVLGKEILGKPRDEEEARRMLRSLSGRAHSVITGFTVVDARTGKTESHSVETRVWVKNLSEGDIEAYVGTGEPLDKAGAYAIQGRGGKLIEKTSPGRAHGGAEAF